MQKFIIARSRDTHDQNPSLLSFAGMNIDQTQRRIIELQMEHRDLDQAIARLAEQTVVDDLALRRMKKRKLQIKDALALLQMQLIPDIPA